MRLLVLACMLGLGLAASLRDPQRCESPPQLTGKFTVGTQNEKLWFYAGYEYDAKGQRIRIHEVGFYQNQSFNFDLLLLFKKGVMYQIDTKASTCVKVSLEGDFQPMGVPPNTTLLGQYVIGSPCKPGEGLLVDTWAGQSPDGAKYLVTVTDSGCIPVTNLYKTQDYGWMVMSYMDNVRGITDPSALVPPDYCPKPEVQPKGKPVDFFTVIENIQKNAR